MHVSVELEHHDAHRQEDIRRIYCEQEKSDFVRMDISTTHSKAMLAMHTVASNIIPPLPCRAMPSYGLVSEAKTPRKCKSNAFVYSHAW